LHAFCRFEHWCDCARRNAGAGIHDGSKAVMMLAPRSIERCFFLVLTPAAKAVGGFYFRSSLARVALQNKNKHRFRRTASKMEKAFVFAVSGCLNHSAFSCHHG
jgi:hypothetical protein